MSFATHPPDHDSFALSQEAFSLVDFWAEAPDYFAKNPFTIHVTHRSGEINEFLNLQIQLKVARFKRLIPAISHQIQAHKIPHTQQTLAPQQEKEAHQQLRFSDKKETILYRKGNRTVEIAISSDQFSQLFNEEKSSKQTAPQKPRSIHKHKTDIFDRFLNEPGFFKRSEHPEEIPPDDAIEESIAQDEDIVTETLAKLNLMQGNLAEAKRIYQQLSLLFPEKSGYFEAEIQKIDDLEK